MKLTIKKIKVKNFKGFNGLEFSPNKDFNIIIGENNAGKSSVFEAIQLWKRCYDLAIKADDKGFYKTNAQANLYLPFPDLYFLRVTSDRELFHTSSHTSIVCLVISNGSRNFELGYEIVKPATISNAYYKVRATKNSNFDEFSDFLREKKIKLSKAIFIYQTRPVASVLANEPIMNTGQISKKIEEGKSQEVLRNKIVIGRTPDQIKQLTNTVRDIVNYNFEFDYVNRTKKDIDEHVDLKIKVNGKSLDLHLQGSGFLQVAEIFSTITYVEAPLSILLVDEPDSHIHTTLQKSLIRKLKSLDESQIMVISHNDNFVGEAKEGELFYLNSSAKDVGVLKSIPLNDFDLVKTELGGTILALEKINCCDKFVFVEGDDDKQYIESLFNIYNSYTGNSLRSSHLTFFHQRGKDYLKRKTENVNRVFSQIVGRKPYLILYDKDYSTLAANKKFSKELISAAPKKSETYSHQGYCIESVLFSEKKLLARTMHRKSGVSIVSIFRFIREFESVYSQGLRDVTSSVYMELNDSFDGQKKDSRPELQNVTFPDFVQDCHANGVFVLEFAMNKHQIKRFVREFNKQFGVTLLDLNGDESSESYSSKLFSLYIDKITKMDHIYDDHREMLGKIYA